MLPANFLLIEQGFVPGKRDLAELCNQLATTPAAADILNRLAAQTSPFETPSIDAVVEHFAKDGLTRADYLRTATRQPQLFYQKPSTIIGHINLLAAMQDSGTLPLPPNRRSLFNYLCSRPNLLVFADDNLHLREITAHLTGAKTMSHSRDYLEKQVRKTLSDETPQPGAANEQGSHARKLLLRALEREGYLKGK
jgi:hypothetical protein